MTPPPFNLGHPAWEDYPRFDIRQHVHRVELPAPGNEADLEALAGRLLSQVMDRNKPLWEIHVVDGLSDGRGAMIVRIHHALADGIAGAAILKIMFDPVREAPPRKAEPVARRTPAPAPEPSLVHAVASAVHGSLKSMVAAEAALLDFAHSLLTERMQTGLQSLLKLMPEWAIPVERLPFNRPCGGERRFCWTEIDLADVKAIRARFGGTVNDVVLAVVTRAVARYAKRHGQPIANRFVRIVCPVSVRQDDQQGSLGNQITFLPVVLPLGVENPAEMLQAVITRMEIMKSVRAAELVGIAAAWIGAAPPQVQALFWEGLPLIPLPVPLFNLICTNVPGSPTPLFCERRRIIASYPQVPTGYELGVGIAVQSYDGKMFFGVTSDAKAAPDATRLRDYLQASFRGSARRRRSEEEAAPPGSRRHRQLIQEEVAGAPNPSISEVRETSARL